jgi:hypothetical protein
MRGNPWERARVKGLKVKIKSLTAEAKIIRLEETKALRVGPKRKPQIELYRYLSYHRRKEVRAEQRDSLLAYAYLRGKPYAKCEKPATTNPPNWSNVLRLVQKFTCFSKPAMKDLEDWYTAKTTTT